MTADLELDIHSSISITRELSEFLDVSVEAASRDLGVSRLDCLEEGIVNEDVLVLSLHHVVALGAKTRHVTIDINSSFVSNPLEHSVDNDERTSATDTSTVKLQDLHVTNYT